MFDNEFCLASLSVATRRVVCGRGSAKSCWTRWSYRLSVASGQIINQGINFFFSEVFCTDYFVRSSDRSILVDLRKKPFYSLSRDTI